MSVAVGTFVLLALALESGGLVDWAQRLELGPERSVAVPMAETLHRGVGWMGLERLRRGELLGLARVGWSDDPVALAEVRGRAVPVRPAVVAGGNVPVVAATAGEPKPAVGMAGVATPRHALRPMVGDPPLLSALPEIAPVGAGKKRTVALAGDSMMAVGLSSTLLREAPAYGDIDMVKAFKSGTGLARPEVFDWQAEYPAMLKDVHPDVVVVAIGANDGQGFVDDHVVYPFGTAGWKAIYQERVQAYLELLEADGATVVWLGLPPMKADDYNARIALVNRIDYAVVSASPHAIWFSTAGVVGDEDGRFQDFGQVRGKTERLRQGDGIHLSDDGAVLVAAKLLPWLAAQDAAVKP
jgi:lysophospholipase L1-like esterase